MISVWISKEEDKAREKSKPCFGALIKARTKEIMEVCFMSAKEREKMGALWKRLTPGILIAVLAVAIVVAVAVGLKHYFLTESKTTELGFEDIGELATQAAYCTEVNVSQEARTLFGVEIPFTQSKNIYSYDVVIKAGLDFEEIEWSVQESDKMIEVWLPEIRILSSEIDYDSFKLYHESESIFTPFTMEENNAAMVSLVTQAEIDAIENGLLDDARSNAELILQGFFANVYDLDEYQIQFKNK